MYRNTINGVKQFTPDEKRRQTLRNQNYTVDRKWNGTRYVPTLTLKQFTGQTPMPFGIHKSRPLAAVPTSYLLHIYYQDWMESWPALKAYIKQHIKAEASMPGVQS